MSERLLPVAILAGGLATRMRPLTTSLPKALLDVNGEPFIAHQLRLLAERGVRHVVVCAAYLGESIQAYVGDGSRFGLTVEFSFDGAQLLGTAGALRKAAPLLGSAFFVLYGDSYLRCDYSVVQATFEGAHCLGLMTVFGNDGRWDRSNVRFTNGQVVAYDKRTSNPSMRHIDYGLGVLDRRALDLVPVAGAYDLTTLYVDLLKRDQLAGFEVLERFYEIGSPAGLEEIRELLVGETTRGQRR